MRAAAVPRTEITIGRGTVAVRQDELDRLLKALAGLDQEGAASIADEIGALRVAGVRIHLLPTESEVAALRAAILAPSRSRALLLVACAPGLESVKRMACSAHSSYRNRLLSRLLRCASPAAQEPCGG